MSILINKDTKVITQGITGKTGQFHTRMLPGLRQRQELLRGRRQPEEGRRELRRHSHLCQRQGSRFGHRRHGQRDLRAARRRRGGDLGSREADLDLAICITEGIPVKDMLEVRNKMKKKEAAGGKKTLLLGAQLPGLITPEEIKIGIMPGHIHRKGRIGVVSRSGTLTYEAVAQLTEIGLGQSSAVGIGGDPINGLKHIDVMRLFNDDPDTDAVIMIGEIGGPDEAEAARWCKANMKKPIVGFIAGVTAPAGKRMGHAGALISGGADTADAKLAIMEECGFTVTRNPSAKWAAAQGPAVAAKQATDIAPQGPLRPLFSGRARLRSFHAPGRVVRPPPKLIPQTHRPRRPDRAHGHVHDPDFWIAVGQIIMIDILLGGDNAVVIALACRKLPPAQRTKGILWGTAGAIVLRIVLIFFALQLLAIPS
jgi:succinyl-CoA synthetase alpha subunit